MNKRTTFALIALCIAFGYFSGYSQITGLSCWGNSYSINTSCSDGQRIVVEKHQPFGSTPACMGTITGGGTAIVDEELAYCMDSNLPSRTDPSDVGQFCWDEIVGISNLPGSTFTIDPLTAARISYMFKQHPDNFIPNSTNANIRSGLQFGLHFLMGESTDDPFGYGAEAVAAVPVLPAYTFAMTNTETGQCTGGNIGDAQFELVTDVSPITLSVSDGGSLPTVCSGSASISGNSLTISGGGVQTITLCLTRPEGSFVTLSAIADNELSIGDDFVMYLPNGHTSQRYLSSETSFMPELNVNTIYATCSGPMNPCASPSCVPSSAQVCEDGSNSVTLVCTAGVSNVIWYDGAGNQLGTNCSLTLDNSDIGTGAAGQSMCFYYEATDSDGCAAESCCPVIVTVNSCDEPCPPQICRNITVVR